MVGIGGSWSEFIDYLFASLKSGDVKLLLEGESRSHGNSYNLILVNILLYQT